MPDERKHGIEGAIERYVDLSNRRPFLVLLALTVMTGLLSLSLSRISLQTRIEALLPRDTVSQRSNDEATRRYAGSAPYFLVVQSSNPKLNRELTEKVLEEVKKWPETLWAMRRRDPKFFLDRRLLYVDEAALGTFATEVDDYVSYQKCKKMPGCFDLEDEPPAKPSFDKLQQTLKNQPEVRSLTTLFGEAALNDLTATGKKPGEGAPKDISGDLCSKDGSVCVVQVTLDREPTDLKFARDMVERGEILLKKLTPKDAPADTITAVTGIYRNLPLTRAALMRDLTRTFSLGIGLMVAVILLQFRPLRSLILLFVPLAMGSIWALGIFAWVSPALNLISAAGFIILAGLGIDFGLHLLTHYGAERQGGLEPRAAVQSTLVSLSSSLTVAALTTAFGFAALMAASFRGFAQLGQFATIGIFMTLLSAFLAFPPLVLGLQKLLPSEAAFSRGWKIPGFLQVGFSARPAFWISSIGLAALVASFLLLPKLSLRQDLTPLIEEAASHGTHFRDALSGTSRGAVLILADDEASLEKAALGIRERFPNGLSEPEAIPGAAMKETRGAAVITPGTFVPDKQEEKLEHIALLNQRAKDAMRFGDAEWKAKLEPWLPLLKITEPLRREDLPPWVINSLSERDGTLGTVGLTYQDYPGSHAGKMLELSQKLDKLRAEHPKVRFASSSSVLGEVMPLLQQDGWRVTGLALLGLFIATLLIGRSRRRTILILLTIFIGVGVTAGLMVLLNWKIDFYNLLVFPVAFGIGVDGAIYVVWSVLGRRGHFDWSDLPVSARAVFGSTMTTLVVFLSLATSQNGGLSSLGKVGSSALIITLVANLVWLPAALSWLNKAADKRDSKEKSKEPVAAAPG